MNLNQNNQFYVYAHYTLDTNELFYIGKGQKDRCKTKRNSYWFKVVNKHNYYIKFLYINLSQEEAYKLEIQSIAEYQPRCNFTRGGSGGDTFTLLPEEQKLEIIQKKKQSMKGKNKGIPKSPEHREKLKCFWRYKKIKCLDTNIIYPSIEECRRSLNLGTINITRQIKHGWKCKGYRLEFIDA